MITKIKYAMIFLMVLVLLPMQAKAEEMTQLPVENAEQVVKDELETKNDALNEEESKEEQAGNKDESKMQKEENENEADFHEADEDDLYEITGTELSISVVPNPKAEMSGSKWKVIKDKKYVFSITITNNSPIDLENFLVYGDIDNNNESNLSNLSFSSQNGVAVYDYEYEGETQYVVDGAAEVEQLKSGQSITLQAEAVIPGNIGDTYTLTVYSELFDEVLGYVQYDLLIANENTPVQEESKLPESEKKPAAKSPAKPAEQTANNKNVTKTAAKTGDASSTTMYFGVIALSTLAILLSKKLYK